VILTTLPSAAAGWCALSRIFSVTQRDEPCQMEQRYFAANDMARQTLAGFLVVTLTGRVAETGLGLRPDLTSRAGTKCAMTITGQQMTATCPGGTAGRLGQEPGT